MWYNRVTEWAKQHPFLEKQTNIQTNINRKQRNKQTKAQTDRQTGVGWGLVSAEGWRGWGQGGLNHD